MKVVRFGNGDFTLLLTQDELAEARSLASVGYMEKMLSEAKIEAGKADPLRGKKIQLIYSSIRNFDCGVDCSDMIRHLTKPSIPVYFSMRAIRRLEQGEFCGSAYGDAKLFIKVGK